MKFFIVVCAAFAVAGAKPSGTLLAAPAVYTVAGSPLLSQYHSQDELGQYAYGYNGLTSAKQETKTLDGITRGSYSYYDAEGKFQTVQYSSDSINGFRVAATNLPKAPIDTGIAPAPIEDTPEVILARSEHLKALKEAEERAAAAAVEAPKPELPITEIKTSAPLAPAPLAITGQPIIALNSNIPSAFSYSYSAPAYAYTVGAPYISNYPIISSPIVASSSPALIAAPSPAIIAAPAPAVIAARSLNIDSEIPISPEETPEVAKARAEHLAIVAEENARIKSTQ